MQFCNIEQQPYNTKMYTEDQLETSTKNTLKTDKYELSTSITGTAIQIHLKSPPTHKQYHRYSTSISLSDLEVSLHDKFEDLKNLQVFLCDRNNISVDLTTGVIQLIISISLLNGKAITTKLGEIRLKEDIFDSEKCLDHILASCEQVGSFNEGSYKNVVRQLANMMKVLFKKVQILDENLNQSDRQAFYTFKSNSAKNLRFNSSSCQKTPKTEKGLQESVKENQEHEFNQLSQKSSSNRFKAFCTKQEIQILKKQLNSKISSITQKQQKQELETSILDIKIQQIRRQLKSEMELLSKNLQNSKENGHSFSRVQGACQNNLMMIRSVQSEGVSPRSKQASFENNLVQSNVVDDDLKMLKTQFEDFSAAVIAKIENLGKANELLEDKLKTIVMELDIRLEQRILKESIEQIKTKIIDVESPYFGQFKLNGTEIEYKGQDSLSTMLLSKVKLSEKSKYSIKIVKTLVSNIQIGIIDAEFRSRRDCWSVQNFILYVGWNSTIYEGPNDMLHKEGNPIAEGDIVTVRANLQTGLIEWLVGGQVRAKIVWQKLKNKSINWVPMVRFYDHGDIISWMTDKMLRI